MGLLLLSLFLILPVSAETLDWMPWQDSVFEQAKRENKFVLLDLEAVWCHWCHVMEATTYQDPAVVALLKSKYLLVKVDQDSRPDLSNRYEDYGWPATIVFNGSRTEIVKRQGYIPPKQMASMLKAIIDDPSPGPSARVQPPPELPATAALSPDLTAQLKAAYLKAYDSKLGSWGFNQKYLDWDSVEYAMMLAAEGDARAATMAKQTLTAQLQLLDPAWGGVYQYSTDGDWKHPHFEKIMQMQSENLRSFAEGWRVFHDPKYLHAAEEIHRYLTTFLLSPDGAFYTSQDADLVDGQHSAHYFALGDAARRKLGVPRIDRHIYARENGWAINALAVLYQATGEPKYLNEARRAADWIVKNRSIGDGGFRHGEQTAGAYLGDTLAMARAFLKLYGVTGERQWLEQARTSVRFIDANFRDPRGAGYLTAKPAPGQAFPPQPERDENAVLARVSNLLFRYTGDEKYQAIAETAMRYVASPRVARVFPVATALLTNKQLATQPVHATVVGHKDDEAAKALYTAALQSGPGYKFVEWWDKREGPLPNPGIEYPELKRPAAFICTEKACSSPIFDVEKLKSKLTGRSTL